MNKKTKYSVLFIFFAFSCILSGCWNNKELEDLNIVIGMGISQSKEANKIEITAQIAKPAETRGSKNSMGSSGTEPYFNLKSTGVTVADTIRHFTHQTNNLLYLAHNEVLLFSNDVARQGISNYIDFYFRNYEPRLTTWVLLADSDIDDIFEIKAGLEKIPAVNITELLEAQKFNSQSYSIRLNELVKGMMSDSKTSVLPIIKTSFSNGRRYFNISGLGVLKNDKLVGVLTEAESRGLLWVKGKVQNAIIDVSSANSEGKTSIEITKSKGKIVPSFDKGIRKVKIIVKVEGFVAGQMTSKAYVTPQALKSLELDTSSSIKKEIMLSLRKSKELNSDIFGFGSSIHKKQPKNWKEIKKDWDDIFTDIKVEVLVETKLRRIGRITKPIN